MCGYKHINKVVKKTQGMFNSSITPKRYSHYDDIHVIQNVKNINRF